MIKFMSFFSFYFDMKKCSKCNRLLPESSFKLRKGKLYYMCRECEKEYMRDNHMNIIKLANYLIKDETVQI
jgi:hypothetical protein|nr:MAG TPA: zinc-ribbon domain protein [Crassvirales sp.]